MNETGISTFGLQPGCRMLVAGGCGGIGKVLVETALQMDVEVAILDLQSSIDQLDKEDGAIYLPFDARSDESIVSAVTRLTSVWDRIDKFVFLSGFPILPRRNLSDVSLAKWDELMAVNLTSAYLLTNAVLPLLRKGMDPAIVTVASSLAYQVMPGMGAYAASKGGLVSLTKALAMELAPLIRVNAVAPGAVDTEFLGGGTGRSNEDTNRAWFDEMSAKYVSTIPLARIAEPIDVVNPIFFLAGLGASYMTGQVLHLNGGRLTP
jgi:NAD(P)-dependent dehydrogenase (short-subunit alcohol dehydrogenase family)